MDTPKEESPGGETATEAPGKAWLIAFFAMAVVAVGTAILAGDQGLVQQFYFRVIVAISVAGIAAVIPGFFTIRLSWLKNTIRAGGAIAVFVFIYLFNPAEVSDTFRPTIQLTGDWNFFLQSKDGDIPGGVARIAHQKGHNVFTISGDVATNPKAPEGAYNSPMITFDSDFAMITNKKIIFHYSTNQGEEGVAVANYTGSSVEELLFSFRDYSAYDDDGFPTGVLIFRRVPSAE